MRIIKYFLIVSVLLFLSTGCNTFKGMGKDIEGAGQSIQKASDKVKSKIP